MKKIFFILLSLTLLLSCKKEEEYVSFSIVTNNFFFGFDSLQADYTIVAPGRVNIEDHGIEYKSASLPPDSGRVSFGALNKPGMYHGIVTNLNAFTNYNFVLYAVSNGKRIRSQTYSGSTGGAP